MNHYPEGHPQHEITELMLQRIEKHMRDGLMKAAQQTGDRLRAEAGVAKKSKGKGKKSC